MIKVGQRFNFKKIFIVVIIALVILTIDFLIYDSNEPFVHPLFTRQIHSACPYYKDFLGRVYYRSSYIPSDYFFIYGPLNQKVEYNWYRIRGIDNHNFKIEKAMSEKQIERDRAETQTTCIASDGKNLIYKNHVFPNADVGSFEELEDFYYKDKDAVYYSSSEIIPEADPQTFEMIKSDDCPYSDSRFTRDKNKVFYDNKIVEQADRDSFELICSFNSGVVTKGKDKNHTYQGSKIEN